MDFVRRFAGRVLLVSLVLLLVGWAVTAFSVVAWGRRDAADPADAIVVLGAAQYAGKPSPVLRARLDHGIALWRRGMAPKLVLTGGVGRGDTTSEAAVGRRYALQQGVPIGAILVEDRGRTTIESLRAVSELAETHDFHRVILVSDPFHMLRVQLLAIRHGLDATTSPTRTSPITANRERQWAYVLSESVKVPVTLLFGHEAPPPVVPAVVKRVLTPRD